MATPNLATVGLSVTPKVLASAQLASGDNTVYTVGTSKAALLDPLVLNNQSAAAVTLSVSVVPSGGTLDGTHRVISGYSLPAGGTLIVDEVKGWLGAGDYISVNSGTGSVIDATLRGLEFA